MRKTKKMIFYILSVFCAVTFSLGFSSCKQSSVSGLHSAGFLADLFGHKLETVEKRSATCEEVGWEEYEACVKCEYSTYKEISALGHTMQSHAAKAPTCEDSGYDAYEDCSRCGESTFKRIPALGHDLEHFDLQMPTCLHAGWYEYDACKREDCDYTTEKNPIPILTGHEQYWEEYEGKPADCYEAGWEPYVVCSFCNDTDYKEIEQGNHLYNIVVTATCVENGYTVRTCKLCGYVDEEFTRAYGHYIKKNDGKAPTCTEYGWEPYETCRHSGCEYTTYQRIPELGHDVENYDGQEPTCTQDGWAAYEKCVRAGCDYNTYRSVPAVGHSFEDGICEVCGEYQSNLRYLLTEDKTSYAVVGMDFPYNVNEIVIPATYEGLPVTSIADSAFEGNTYLQKLKIPASVTEIGRKAFYGCNKLTELYYSGNVEGWLAMSMGDEFANPLYYAYKFFIKTNGEFEAVTKLEIPDTVTQIREGAFRNCYTLTELIISGKVTSVGAKAFYNCVNLKTAEISGSIGASAFRNCFSLTDISLNENVDSIDEYAFMDCGVLTELILPDSVTEIGASAFYNCLALENVSLGNGVRSIGNYAFKNSEKLQSVGVGIALTVVGESAFENCTALTKVEISDVGAWVSVDFENNLSNPLFYAKNLNFTDGKRSEPLKNAVIPSGVKIVSARTFINCETLESVVVEDGAGLTAIGNLAFTGCKNLKSVDFGKNSALASIGASAFAFCGELTSIVIPETVAVIGNYAFQGCNKLTSVTFQNTENWQTYEYVSGDLEAQTGTKLSAKWLADKSQAAEYLTKKYYEYYWYIVK